MERLIRRALKLNSISPNRIKVDFVNEQFDFKIGTALGFGIFSDSIYIFMTPSYLSRKRYMNGKVSLGLGLRS